MIPTQTLIQLSFSHILLTAFTYKHAHTYIDPQIFLQCISVDVRVLFMPCPQAESVLAAGQNKPATESTEPLDVSKQDKETDHYVPSLSVHLPPASPELMPPISLSFCSA